MTPLIGTVLQKTDSAQGGVLHPTEPYLLQPCDVKRVTLAHATDGCKMA